MRVSSPNARDNQARLYDGVGGFRSSASVNHDTWGSEHHQQVQPKMDLFSPSVTEEGKPRFEITPLKTTASAAPFRRRYDVTNSCDGSIPGAAIFALAAALALVVAVGDAWADRHCSPVLFRYYDARTALHETENACPDRLAKALEFMNEAAAEAAACGCLDVEAEIETFIGELQAINENCSAAERKILELDTHLEDRVAGCN